MKSVITGLAIFIGVILMFVLFGGYYPNNSKNFSDTDEQSKRLIQKQKDYILSKKSEINILSSSCPNKRDGKVNENESILKQTLKNEYKNKSIEVKNDNRALNSLKTKLLQTKERLAYKNRELHKLKSQLILLKKDFKSTKQSTQKELAKTEELNQKYLQKSKEYEDAQKIITNAQEDIKKLNTELRMKDDRLQMLKAELLALKKEQKALEKTSKKPIAAIEAPKKEPAISQEKKERIQKEKIIIEVDKKIKEILALSKVEFKSGSFELTKKSKKILHKVADVIKEYKNFNYIIEGHTDSSGNEAYNLHLSDKRAKKVKAYLIELGVEKNILTAKGFGSSNPIASNSTKEGRIQNRRVVIKIK